MPQHGYERDRGRMDRREGRSGPDERGHWYRSGFERDERRQQDRDDEPSRFDAWPGQGYGGEGYSGESGLGRRAQGQEARGFEGWPGQGYGAEGYGGEGYADPYRGEPRGAERYAPGGSLQHQGEAYRRPGREGGGEPHALGWRSPGPYSGRGPRGYARSDDRIRDDVCEELAEAGQVDASDIEVSVEDGVVTLTGTVPDRRMKRMAEDAADSCNGVRDVRNELQLRPREQGGGGGRMGDTGWRPAHELEARGGTTGAGGTTEPGGAQQSTGTTAHAQSRTGAQRGVAPNEIEDESVSGNTLEQDRHPTPPASTSTMGP
jgi:hypothetical protein